MMQGHTHKCDAIWQPDRAIRLQIRRDTSEWMGVSFYIVPFGPGILLFGDTTHRSQQNGYLHNASSLIQ